MNLLEWARGPLLTAAIIIFITGIAWRLFALWRLPASRPGAPARQAFGRGDALAVAASRMLPRQTMRYSATLVTIKPYVFHIGLALIFFGYAPHIAFVQRLTGLSWPALPDMVMYLAAAATLVSLVMALVFRLTDPVLRKISRFDDMFTWVVTMAPLVTGMAVVGEPSAAILARGHVIGRAHV